jgi:hypothetical protein
MNEFILLMTVSAVAVLGLWLTHRDRPRRMNRDERMGLDRYEHKARSEGAFPFDYLTR